MYTENWVHYYVPFILALSLDQLWHGNNKRIVYKKHDPPNYVVTCHPGVCSSV